MRENEIYSQKEILIRAILGAQTFGFQTPPPSNTRLPPFPPPSPPKKGVPLHLRVRAAATGTPTLPAPPVSTALPPLCGSGAHWRRLCRCIQLCQARSQEPKTQHALLHAYCGLGRCLLKEGKYKQAETALRKNLEKAAAFGIFHQPHPPSTWELSSKYDDDYKDCYSLLQVDGGLRGNPAPNCKQAFACIFFPCLYSEHPLFSLQKDGTP